MIRAVVARTLAVLLVATAWSPRPVRADAVVGTGTPASCTEAALNSALAGGGNVTFNCGGPATITVTGTKGISADTTIDGGGVIIISGGNSVEVFSVNTGVNFTVQNLTIANGNSAGAEGGGISNDGTLNVTNSTFSGNSTNGPSGGGNSNVTLSSSPPPTERTVTGTVLMPNGQLAQLDPSFLQRFAGLAVQEADALTGNVSPVSGNVQVTLTLLTSDGRVQNYGTTLTNDQGQYPSTTPTATSTPTPTQTVPPTSTPRPCAGDCNDDGTVTVDEILTMVNIALGNAPPDACLAGDMNGDRTITVDEILAAVNSALNGCAAQPTGILQFVGFDSSGITQADSVRESIADVDILQEICLSGTPEPFTQTIINATFRNNEAADLHLQQVRIAVGPAGSLATITHQLDGDIPGGRCSNIDQQCSTDADCTSASSTTAGTCLHTETTINGILLFDFSDKQRFLSQPGTYNVTITFFASDLVRTFQTSTAYTVTFADFDNCTMLSGWGKPRQSGRVNR